MVHGLEFDGRDNATVGPGCVRQCGCVSCDTYEIRTEGDEKILETDVALGFCVSKQKKTGTTKTVANP